MPRGNTLFIGRPPPPWVPAGTDPATAAAEKRYEKIESPLIRGWQSQHSLLRYLTALHEVGLAEGIKMTGLPPRTPRLLESDGDLGLMVSLSRGSYSDVILGFPILTDKGDWNTNWPLLPSFPLFWRNVLYTLGNIRDAAGEEPVQPGQVKLLRPEGKIAKVAVTDPKGARVVLERGSRADFAYGGTESVGIYRAEWEGDGRRFPVNLLDTEESNIEPRYTVQIGYEAVSGSENRQWHLWKFFVAAALIMLLIEWYVYNRRIFV
jgi:hypothetical protein